MHNLVHGFKSTSLAVHVLGFVEPKHYALFLRCRKFRNISSAGVDFVVLSTCSQAIQPPFKMPQAFWKGKFPFLSPKPYFA